MLASVPPRRPALILCTAGLLALAGGSLPGEEPPAAADGPLHLHLRTRVQPFKGQDRWEEAVVDKDIRPRETAVIICDMWDNHWCQAAARRCAALARKMEPVLVAARKSGVTIIHAPSECMDFYKDAPQRKRMTELPRVTPPRPLEISDPPLPIDDKDGGCDDPEPAKPFRAWTRENPALTIADEDFISDNGQEVYSLLRQRGIKTLLICGVHTNMCVCNRSFAIKQMTRWGVPCILIRDLTDSMYNPKKAPFVPHEEGTELVVEHIEK
jgi:nicotinamidase-related amidase